MRNHQATEIFKETTGKKLSTLSLLLFSMVDFEVIATTKLFWELSQKSRFTKVSIYGFGANQ